MSAESAMDVRRRLKVRAAELGLDFQQAVLYYAMERFLFRLSQTRWSDRLVVKGAAMLRVWDASVARPTRDIDFLGRVDNSPEAVRAIVEECLSVQADDGLAFDSAVGVEPIAVEDRYPGVRVKVAGDLFGARFVLRLDVGIDDAVVPEPGWVDYPVLLGDPVPRILAYRPATAVAEKYQAMIEIGLANSRLKDYHDIWMLSRSLEFEGRDLVGAIRATFERRETTIPAETPPELTTVFTGQVETARMWKAYRSGPSAGESVLPEDLQEVADAIEAFIMPASVAASQPSVVFDMTWKPVDGWSSCTAPLDSARGGS